MKASLRQQIHDEIIREIVAGNIQNDTVIREIDLIEKYAVSKSPVRDALIELCKEGVLRSVPRVGYQLVLYDVAYYEGIVRLRLLLESEYLDKYWKRLTPAAIDELEAVQNRYQIDPHNKDPLNYWQHNVNFHVKLAQLLGDDYFSEVLQTAINKQKVLFAQHYWRSWDKSVFSNYMGHHEYIIVAMRDGRKKDAVEALRKDIFTGTSFIRP